jgi:CDGSH-type Zn-finger protein
METHDPTTLPLHSSRSPPARSDAHADRGRGACHHSMPEPRITAYRDGPLIVRGAVRLEDQDGNAIASGRETIALCRCGKSRMRPFCDGTHKVVRFRAPSGAESGRGG